jgi:hypothetical protein
MKTITSISLVLLTTLVLAFMPSNIVLADGVPVIIVEPNPAAPGTQITVTGTDMEDGEVFAITLEGMTGVIPLGEVIAAPDGEEAGFTVTFTIPADFGPGSYFLRAETEEGETATADLIISASALQMNTEPMEASAEPLMVERSKSPLMVGSVILVAIASAGVGLWLIRLSYRPGEKTGRAVRF